MSQLGQALMADIVQSELVPEVASGFNDEIAKFCADATQNDPLHRSYSLTVFQLTADGARFKVCPQ